MLDAGLVSDDSDSARVLVVADSTVTNTASPKRSSGTTGCSSTSSATASRWLVSDLPFVG